jgi:hypothetical protein
MTRFSLLKATQVWKVVAAEGWKVVAAALSFENFLD